MIIHSTAICASNFHLWCCVDGWGQLFEIHFCVEQSRYIIWLGIWNGRSAGVCSASLWFMFVTSLYESQELSSGAAEDKLLCLCRHWQQSSCHEKNTFAWSLPTISYYKCLVLRHLMFRWLFTKCMMSWFIRFLFLSLNLYATCKFTGCHKGCSWGDILVDCPVGSYSDSDFSEEYAASFFRVTELD
jgi:hypothetical protein